MLDTEIAALFGLRVSSIRKFKEGKASYLTKKRIKELAKEKGIDLQKELELSNAISVDSSQSVWATKLGVNDSTLNRYFTGKVSYGSKRKIELLAKQNEIDLNKVKEDILSINKVVDDQKKSTSNELKLKEIASKLDLRVSTIRKYFVGEVSYTAKRKLEEKLKENNILADELSDLIDYEDIEENLEEENLEEENINMRDFRLGDYYLSVWEFGDKDKSRVMIRKYNADIDHVKSKNDIIKEIENIMYNLYSYSDNNGESINYNKHEIELYFNIGYNYEIVFDNIKQYMSNNIKLNPKIES